MMNTVNTSTSFTPFQLCFGQSRRIIPPLIPAKPSATVAVINAWHVIQCLETDVLEAQDNLLRAKISQAVQANKHLMLTFLFTIGSQVQLSTLHQCKEYKAKGEKRVANFMPQHDGLYTILNVNEDHFTVTLDLPNSPNICLTFHTSEILPYIESDTTLFPSCRFEVELNPIVTDDSDEKYFVEHILNAQRCGCGHQYLVCWWGYGQEHDKWLPGSELQTVKCGPLAGLTEGICFILGRFFLFLPAGSFTHWVFDTPSIQIMLTFLLLTSSFLFDFIFFFKGGEGVIPRLPHLVCLALSVDCLALYIHATLSYTYTTTFLTYPLPILVILPSPYSQNHICGQVFLFPL